MRLISNSIKYIADKYHRLNWDTSLKIHVTWGLHGYMLPYLHFRTSPWVLPTVLAHYTKPMGIEHTRVGWMFCMSHGQPLTRPCCPLQPAASCHRAMAMHNDHDPCCALNTINRIQTQGENRLSLTVHRLWESPLNTVHRIYITRLAYYVQPYALCHV